MKIDREIVSIPIGRIKQNLNQPRKIFNQETLIELSESIREYGVLQPISVRKIGNDNYELVAGERRLRASQLAGLSNIPAIIIDISSEESAFMALIENLQREDLNFFEEAEGYEMIIKEYGFTQEVLAAKLGKKQSTIANKLRILKLSDYIKERIKEGKLSERHARALLSINEKTLQERVVEEIIEKGLNVKQTEELIEKYLLKYGGAKETNNKKSKNAMRWNINPRIITNTLKHIMEKNGISAQYSQRDREDYLEIIVKIPKNAV